MTAAIGALLLAAGEGRRYGGPKQIAQLGGLSLVRRAALACLDAGCELRVVLGAHAEIVAAELQELPLQLVINHAWAEGMGSSIACGMRDWLTAVSPQAVLIVLADQPLVGVEQLHQLIDAHQAAPQQLLVAEYDGMRGPPCLFPADCYAELAALSGPQGARAVLQKHADRVLAIAMPQAAVDIDTTDDYARVLSDMS